ncbi:MAG: serine/threonine protein kinase [Candidatus Moranbacteria bacterium]|nr:serine/threonine protein kinase [Candidatus Moranbacteria bacterium]
MSDLMKHFARKEFECKCGCGFNSIDYQLLKILNEIRDYFSVLYGNCQIIITSGNRCPEHNKKIGGAPKSFHVRGTACDFKVVVDGKELMPEFVYNYLNYKYKGKFGIRKYNSWVHLDVRETEHRWQQES